MYIFFEIVSLFFLGYVVGAIPVGFLVARLRGISDIREHGSGTSGATNVARLLGFKYFFLIFFLDAGKAYALTFFLLKKDFSSYALFVFIIALVFGNIYPVFLGGKGGKGFATTLGIVAALSPLLFTFIFVLWIVVFAETKTVGSASVIALVLLPVFSFILSFFSDFDFFIFSLPITGLCLYAHRAHIKNLLKL